MSLGVINQEWVVQNSQRAYPFFREAGRQDTAGAFEIPADFLVGLDLPVHAGVDVDPSRFYVKRLSVFGTGFALTVGYDPDGGSPVDVATATIPRDQHSPFTAFDLVGEGSFEDSRGTVVIGDLGNIDRQPSGAFDFVLTQTRLEPDTVRPILRGVSSFRVRSGTSVSPPVTGDVELVAGENVILERISDTQIRISAIEGEGLTASCEAVGQEQESPAIRRINGISPTPEGDFQLVGSDCLETTGIQHGTRLDDVCSRPCCGCEELEVITQDLRALRQQAATLDTFVARLQGSVQQMDQVVLGSKLGDKACFDEGA